MNAQAETLPGAISSPALGVLQLEMSVNVTDKQLRKNLEFAKSLGLPELKIIDPHEHTLAIVGSGPSVEETYKFIPTDCDIMALNGAYRFLRGVGITPDFFAMLDARPVNVNFLEGMLTDKTVYLIASQCAPEIFAELRNHTSLLFHLGTPTTNLVFPDAELRVGGGGTIGLTAISLAMAMGYRKVILYGLDSSFKEGKTHVIPQPQNIGEENMEVWVEDRKYATTKAMAAQVMDFFPFWKAVLREAPDFDLRIVGSGLFYDFIDTNNHAATVDSELAKYQGAYQLSDYGMTEERKNALNQLLGEFPGCDSYLDVSCGRGETLDLARNHGFQVVRGTETVNELLGPSVTHAVLPYLPFKSCAYDVVSLIEVIEHILPEYLEESLQELTRVARKHILISAATRDCWLGGVNLHPSAMPLEEWESLFSKIWKNKFRRVRNLGGSPCWRVDL